MHNTETHIRKDWDSYFMDLAHAASTRATCPKRQVGALLVKNNKIISTGYNGAPSGEPHCIDVGCLEVNGKCKRVIHAEINAVRHASRWQRCGSIMYCTLFPCLNCAQTIAKSGITEVVYGAPYTSYQDEVVALFLDQGIAFRDYCGQ